MKLREETFMDVARWSHLSLRRDEQKWVATGASNGAYVEFDVGLQEDGTVRIARHGRLEISTSGDRDPEWRHTARQRFGVGCDLATEFAGQLICPHTKRVIPVSRIEGNPALWVDYEHGVAIRSGGVKYETPTAKPLPRATARPIEYSFANRKAEVALIKRLRPIWEEAKLRMSLAAPTTATGYQTEQCLRMLVSNPNATDFLALAEATMQGNDPIAHMSNLAWGIQMCRPWDEEYWASRAKVLTADAYKATYLEIAQ